MRASISNRITLYLVVFSIIIIGIIGIAGKFFLPNYYTNYQLDIINSKTSEIVELYNVNEPDAALSIIEELRQLVGGEIYLQSENGQINGFVTGRGNNSSIMGKNQGHILKNSESFIPNGDITYYNYENKIGLEVYTLGINVNDEYIVYEVTIQSLNKAVDVVLSFLWILLLVVLAIAVGVAMFLSRTISKPIKDLNNLAKNMMNKKVKAVMVTNNEDEIGKLNHSLNELYEELLSSIYQLESELNKERNAENLKKRFLAQATHELKTPIAVIGGYAEILYDGMYKDEDDRDRYLKNIYEETQAISHLIKDVLDYTKMETGNYELLIEKVSAKNYFEGIVNRFEDYVKEYGLNFLKSIELDNQFELNIDKTRIEQVIRNLLSNSVEHGVTKVIVNVARLQDKVKIQISNDGPLIEEEDLPYIFDSFYKKKGKQSGTGLGLAVVKEIVLLHGGDYRVENSEEGVIFTIIV